MIDYNLTPNERAKLSLYNSIEAALFDGAKYEYPDMTDREAQATEDALSKQTNRLYKILGMRRIFSKIGIDR
jgi:hypothetical protein